MDGSIPKPSGQSDNKPVVIPKLPRASLAKREASARHSFSSFLACQSQQSSQLDDIYAACLDKRENWSNLGDSLKNGVSIEELKYDLVAMMVVFVICEIFTCNVVIIISLSSTPTLLNRPHTFRWAFKLSIKGEISWHSVANRFFAPLVGRGWDDSALDEHPNWTSKHPSCHRRF